MKGVCCTCQSMHEVREKGIVELYEGYADDDEVPFIADDSPFRFKMATHDFPGTFERCEGSNTEPQALVKE